MNKFRVSLHPALFFPGSNGYSEDPRFGDNPEAENNVPEGYQADSEEYQVAEVEEQAAAGEAVEEVAETTEEVTGELQDLEEEVVEEQDVEEEAAEEEAAEEVAEDFTQKVEEELSNFDSNFFNFFNNIGTEVQNRRHDRGDNDLGRKVEMVRNRHRGNILEWNKSVKEGYEDLLKTLLKNKYFDSPVSKDVNAIRKMYSDVVADQYETYVWDSKDNVFDEVKDKLFTRAMGEEYPANLVYKKLNNDAEIFERDVQERYSYRVEAVHTENYEANKELVDSWQWKDKRKFLGETLPNYLRGISSTTDLQKLLQYTPLVGNKIDRASDEDKRGIKDFISIVERLNLKDGVTDTPEILLLEIFKDAKSNRTQQQWKDAFDKKGLILNTRYPSKFFDSLNRAYKFYAESQSATSSVDKQHNLYLSVLGIVEAEGGFDETIAKFKDDAEMYAKEKRNLDASELEKEDADLYSLSEKLNKDYESVLRLSRMDVESFANRDAVDIIADFNNDGAVLQSDRGAAKSGLQFKQIFQRIGDRAQINLLNHAKLLNNTMGLGLTDEDLNWSQIKAGNKKLILLLQSIVSQPGEDLYTLLTLGTNGADKYADQIRAIENAPKGPDDPEVQKAADKLLEGLGDVNIDELKKIEGFNGETAATREGLHQAVAGALYTEYARGLGLGATIPFDQWVDGLAVNGGFQVGDTGLSFGLTLSYKKELELGKGWTITPQTSIGYIPFISFDGVGNGWGTGSVGAEIAKKWIDKNDIAQKIGLNLSYTRVFGTANVYSALVGRSRDKLAGVEGSVESKKQEYKELVSPLINTIGEFLDGRPLDLNDETILNGVKDILNSKVDAELSEEEKSKIGAEGRQKFIDNMIRYLCNFNNLDFSNKTVRDFVANDMSEKYALAREHATKSGIDGKSYISGTRLGFSWVQLGSFGVGIVHAGLSWKKHMSDVYGDGSIRRHIVSAEHFDVINENVLDKINRMLHLEGVELKFNDEGYVVIPSSLLRNAYINAGMKGKIKKDENGNVLIHKETVLELPAITEGTTTESIRLNVGGNGDFVQLSSVVNDPEWFTEGDINPEELTGKEEFTIELLEKALADLRLKAPELSEYHFDESILSKLQYGHKYKITLKREGGKIDAKVDEVFDRSQKDLTIEYKSLQEARMMSREAQDVADCVYAEAGKIVTNALYNISHTYKFKDGNGVEHKNREWPLYTKFALAMRDGNYEEARNVLVGTNDKDGLLSRVEKELNRYGAQKEQISFSYEEGESRVSVSDTLKGLEGAELGKALMSINNIFARVGGVKGGPDGYTFKYGGKESPMDKIVESRAKNISNSINNSELPKEAKDAYQSLINFAEGYRKDHPEAYADSKKKALCLDNAIGFNLGNRYNVENPLFNPEIYEGSLIENLDFEGKDVLLERALRNIVSNESLFDPIKSELHLEGEITNIEYENGKLILDIGEEKVKLSAEMKFAYFAQCVNHMLIIDNIRAETGKDGGVVELWNSVLRDGRVNEGTVKERMATITTSVDLAFKVPGQTGGESYTTPDEEEVDGNSTGSQNNDNNDNKANGNQGAGNGDTNTGTAGGKTW